MLQNGAYESFSVTECGSSFLPHLHLHINLPCSSKTMAPPPHRVPKQWPHPLPYSFPPLTLSISYVPVLSLSKVSLGVMQLSVYLCLEGKASWFLLQHPGQHPAVPFWTSLLDWDMWWGNDRHHHHCVMSHGLPEEPCYTENHFAISESLLHALGCFLGNLSSRGHGTGRRLSCIP